MSKALAQAIERHKAARAAFDAQEDSEDGTLNRLGWAADRALEALIETPAGSDAELFTKLRYLLAHETFLAGHAPSIGEGFGGVAVALDMHLNPEA